MAGGGMIYGQSSNQLINCMKLTLTEGKKMQLMRKLAFGAVLVLAFPACSTFSLDKLNAEGAASGAFCIEGSGPPMTGSGHLAGAHTNDGFKGLIIITPNCG